MAAKMKSVAKAKDLRTKHLDIALYWDDKVLYPDGHVETWNGDSSGEMMITDIGEPACWACGYPVTLSATKLAEIEALPNIESVYKHKLVTSRLQRCHLIPRAKGGSDDPSNIVLLCPECHAQAPDTAHSKHMLRWIYKRKKEYTFGKLNPRILIDRAMKTLIDLGYDVSGIPELVRDLTNEQCKDYVRSLAGLHASAVKESTQEAVITDMFESLLSTEDPMGV